MPKNKLLFEYYKNRCSIGCSAS